MNLERVIEALAPTDVVQRAPVEISDLAYDTRAVRPGALFFCVPGERHDGHTFAREAVERGAVALVVERPLELDVVQLVVADARGAMAQARSPSSTTRRGSSRSPASRVRTGRRPPLSCSIRFSPRPGAARACSARSRARSEERRVG